MKANPLQFAVVREDPSIELQLIGKYGLNRVILIGSGGCTFFSVKSRFPTVDVTLIEPNPAQIELINQKIPILENASTEEVRSKFGVGRANPLSLIEGGNFESLFRQFRSFINEFIVDSDTIANGFDRRDFWERVFEHRYWPVAFELFFSDSILVTMFGETAIQHAPPNSYPNYFKRVLERGLRRPDAGQNYFLHHIFLGYYLGESLPLYLNTLPTEFDVHFFRGFAQDFDDFTGRSLVHFSNIFDWCDESVVKSIASATQSLDRGSIVVFRQLNNTRDYREIFGSCFRWTDTSMIIARDMSLFYEKIEIGEKSL